ncbi:replication protein A 70 kDa DNA-binding subunit B-like [Magnolia sinica]|uniref:replication protein A 70 kDa DNA-binding subunit B-like n=1 Tax=Magnolia sinica TaxID=86752 RepID=UPI002659A133|nr:replication protein A 70 kDa DNA-binding subunit B-like [Magnolia sinica]
MANDGKMKLKAMLLIHSSSEIHSRKLQNFGLISILDYTCNAIPNQPGKWCSYVVIDFTGNALSHLASEQVCLAWSRTSSPRVKSASSISKNQGHKRSSHCGALHLLDRLSLICFFILKPSIVDFSFYGQVCKSDK